MSVSEQTTPPPASPAAIALSVARLAESHTGLLVVLTGNE